MKKTNYILLLIVSLAAFHSCRSVPRGRTELSRELLGKPVMSARALSEYFASQNPLADKKQIEKFALLYISEASYEGINSDLAFAQMCLETGYLRFGNLVVPEMHNYCGLGAIDADRPGEWFETEQLGVRAHIQHLQAYATTEDVKLNRPLIDPRYGWVHKTKLARTVFDLAGSWATDPLYGHKLDAILEKMSDFAY